jgi:hypothetical protein
MRPSTLRFEDIPFDQLTPFRIKRHRSVFIHRAKNVVYKLYVPGWEFANQPSIGYELGFYDEKIVPNLVGLIKDGQGRNRGYAMERVPARLIVAHVNQPVFSPRTWLAVYQHRLQLIDVVWPNVHRNADYLLDCLRLLLSRSLATGVFFAEMSPPNMWIGKGGYYIFDLDALRFNDWLFTHDTANHEYIRRVVNRKSINDDLHSLVALHGFVPHGYLAVASDIPQYWQEFLQHNNLSLERYGLLPT